MKVAADRNQDRRREKRYALGITPHDGWVGLVGTYRFVIWHDGALGLRRPVLSYVAGRSVAGPPWLATYMASSRRLQTPSLSKALRKWFLMTCSVVPTILPISRSVRPSQTRIAI
jgi:hypothetical protein